MTQDVLKEYISRLYPEVQQMYHLADQYTKANDDTLADEWQIAAMVVALFWDKALEHDKRWRR
jgi:hypothetical protein